MRQLDYITDMKTKYLFVNFCALACANILKAGESLDTGVQHPKFTGLTITAWTPNQWVNILGERKPEMQQLRSVSKVCSVQKETQHGLWTTIARLSRRVRLRPPSKRSSNVWNMGWGLSSRKGLGLRSSSRPLRFPDYCRRDGRVTLWMYKEIYLKS
jgi:hypothetical protein